MQKGIFYMAKEHLLLFSYESFLQRSDAKWRSFQSYFLSILQYYGVQSLVCSPMNDKRMCFIYPIRMSLPTFVRCAFPLHHRRSGTPQQSSFPSRLPDLQWSRPSQSSSRKTSYHLFHYHSVCSFCHTVLFIGGFPIDCTVIQILNIGCKTRVGERCHMSYKRYFMVLCIAFVLFAAAS